MLPLPPHLEVGPFLTLTLTLLLLLIGKWVTVHVRVLRQYSIPEPVVGGMLCAAVVGGLYFAADTQVHFELGLRDWFLLAFFAVIGLKSDIRTLLSGGKPLIILLLIATSYIVLQNGLGMGVASLFGLDPKLGLMVGSVSLTGGVGTTISWAPIFINEHGLSNAMEVGIAANMIGLIAACLMGGPLASWLIRRYGIQTSGDRQLDVGAVHDTLLPVRLDYESILQALFVLNLTLILGFGFEALLKQTSLQLPSFVSSLFAGIVVRNVSQAFRLTHWMTHARSQNALALISDLCLGLFLTMALMGLQLWALQDVFLFVTVALLIQIAVAALFTIFVVFRSMGKDYEAAVVVSGFGGIVLGSTATAVANMTAVAQQYGAAHRAFVIVPLVCGFFIDLANALIVSFFLSW
ncbi:MAG: sodium/glutamate symporter [Pigmentiphaga sp.]